MDDWIIVEHPDGRRYSVSRETFEARYRDQGFVAKGEERLEDFTADVPRPKRRAGARRKPAATRTRPRTRGKPGC